MDSVSLQVFRNLQLFLTSPSGHHDAEEAVLFPEIEKVTGEEGIMNRNVEQHHGFLPGLEAWSQYSSDCMKKEGPSKFDATQFTKLIGSFAPQLVAHLAEEIPTLLALDKYDIAAVKKAFQNFDKHMMSKSDVVGIPVPVLIHSLTVLVEHLPFRDGDCRLDLRGRQQLSRATILCAVSCAICVWEKTSVCVALQSQHFAWGEETTGLSTKR
jgi:hypothetical protein